MVEWHGDIQAFSRRRHGDIQAFSRRRHGDIQTFSRRRHGDIQAFSRRRHGDAAFARVRLARRPAAVPAAAKQSRSTASGAAGSFALRAYSDWQSPAGETARRAKPDPGASYFGTL
jgi:hypothetical protein